VHLAAAVERAQNKRVGKGEGLHVGLGQALHKKQVVLTSTWGVRKALPLVSRRPRPACIERDYNPIWWRGSVSFHHHERKKERKKEERAL
jgi:hypothetical protein